MDNKNLQTSRARKWTKNIIKLKEGNIIKRIIKNEIYTKKNIKDKYGPYRTVKEIIC